MLLIEYWIGVISRFLQKNPLLVKGTVLLLAGDISYLSDRKLIKNPFWDWAADHYEQTYIVPGNHEYYGGFELSETLDGFTEPIRSNVSFRNNQSVLTHHVPTLLCHPEKYKNSPLTDAFVVELHDFIFDSEVDYWVYGHSHGSMPEIDVNGTKLLCNQLGVR